MAATHGTRRIVRMTATLLLLGSFCAYSAAQAGGLSDKDKLQGNWIVQSAVKGGEKLPEVITKTVKATFKGDKIILEFAGESQEGTAKLDATKRPKTIDINVGDKTLQGIYEINGPMVKVCLGDPGQGRPTKFESPAGSETIYVVFIRPKVERKGQKLPPKPAANSGRFRAVRAVQTEQANQGTKKPQGKSDKDLFQGPWKLVAIDKEGEKAPQELIDNIKIAFKGDKVVMEFMGMSKEGDFRLDPSTKPKSIDMTIDDKAVKGIYQLDGNSLKICLKDGGGRPTKFETAAGSQSILIVLKREKAAKKEEKKAGALQFTPADFAVCCASEISAKASQKTDKDGFQGDWEVISAEKAGEKIAEEMLNQIKIKFTGDKLVLDLFGTKQEGTFKLDPTKKPKTIDLTLDDKTSSGIYELTGDTLKIALAEPGKARPKDFNGTAGTENSQVSLKRGKAKGEKKEEKKTTSRTEVKQVSTKEVKGGPVSVGKKSDRDGLQGVWKLVALEVSGKKMDASELGGMRLIFVGDKATAIIGGLTDLEEGTWKVDPTQKPRQLDSHASGQDHAGDLSVGGRQANDLRLRTGRR